MNSVKPIIEIKNIGKRYNITHQRGGYVSLRDVVMNILKSPFAFLKTKAKQAVGLEKKEDFWALREVSFNVEKGEVVGIIGANGAGKSTLLKILSQITPPTEGEIILRGRVGSLLEVGTGFHPELTGRENIFLNGAILGMKKKEIESRFDAIVEFAGIGKFLDTPVKFYSSGMHVRLAFSVAAHMDPDILIIDEVLAVGDAEFQKKCLGKMDEITKTQGRTILFVSHNMSAVRQLCQKTILIEKGIVKDIGDTNQIVDKYIEKESSMDIINLKERKDRKGSGKIRLSKISFKNDKDENVTSFICGEKAQFWLEFESNDHNIKDLIFYINVDSVSNETRITTLSNKFSGQKISSDKKLIKISIDKLPLNAGYYYITLFVEGRDGIYDWIQKASIFSVRHKDFYGTGELPNAIQGPILLNYIFTN